MNEENNKKNKKEIISILLAGGIGVFPTDTIYGLVGSALDKKTVERIYALRERDLKKPMIILISSMDDLEKFGVKMNSKQKKILEKFWPGKVSVIFNCPLKKFEYLHRSEKTLAFRFPNDKNLIEVLKKTGPLFAPSANLAGKKPAETYLEAKKYFGNRADFYVDSGKLKSIQSTLIRLDVSGNITVIREGAVKIK